MPQVWSPEELRSRFAAYIEELREFFDCHRLPHGSPADLLALAVKLDQPGAFRDEMSSMLRAIILRQGGIVPPTELVEIVTVACGGNSVDPTAPELQPALRRLLGFAAATVRRPWNEPPDQLAPAPEPPPSKAGEVIPFKRASGPQTMPAVRPATGFASAGHGHRKAAPDGEPTTDPSAAFAAVVAARVAAFSPAAPPRAERAAETLPAPASRQPASANRPEATMAEPQAAGHGTQTAPKPLLSSSRLGRTVQRLKPSLRMMGGGAVAAALALGVLLMRAHSTASLAVASTPPPTVHRPQRIQPLATPPQAARPGAGVAASLPATPAPARRHSIHDDDDYIAPPWTGPKPPPLDPAVQPQARPAAQPDSPLLPPTRASGPVETASIAARTASPGRDLPTRPAALTRRPGYLDVSSGVMAANLISAPLPPYPFLARLTHTEGEVVLRAVIGKDGTVSAARVLNGHRLLRSAAAAAVRRWRYRPYRVSGDPVEVSTIVTVEFRDHH